MTVQDQHDQDESDRVTRVVGELWAAAGASPDGGSFVDSGGDSLAALRLLGAVHRDLGVRLAWSDLDAASGVADLAARVRAARRANGGTP